MKTQIDCKDWTYDQKGDDVGWETIGSRGGRGELIKNLANEFCSELTDYDASKSALGRMLDSLDTFDNFGEFRSNQEIRDSADN